MKLHLVLIAIAAGSFSISASAQTLEPGLWEVSNKMTSASGEMERAAAEMQKEMASMPPEQRKMMEDMMAKQGLEMGGGGQGDVKVRTCMTREMIERNEVPAQQGKCKSTTQPRVGNVTKMSFTCSDPASSGDGQYTVVSPKAYTMKMVVRSAAGGRPETMNLDASGKWLGSDCGDVKPLRSPTER